MQHKRFILAIAISAIILFAWSYFVPQKPIKPDNSNQAANAQPTATATPATQPSVAPTPATPQPQPVTPSVNTTPQRSLVVETPLYEAKFDSKGAIATSWIIKMNKGTGTPEDPPRPLYSVGGDRNNPKPLQLISQEGLKQDPVDAPFGLITGDDVVDKFIVANNYRIDAGTGDESEIRIDLKSGEKTVEFVLHDDATGLDVMKRITFKADYYDVGLETKVTRNGNPLPKTQLVIGPSIGDQGVSHYSFYSVAPEGIGVANGEVKRLLGTSIHTDEEGWIFKTKRPEGPNRYVVNGEVDWAGVGDTYFAMIVVPVQKPSGIEYRTIPYKFDAGGKVEDRFL
ncbi:MAG: membrane protein insertase YidC, partial [Pyrinomonadaceae bacterium]